ncbi:acyl-CoA thioesterase [Leptolyngbya ohadii]|uniref:acyl-CoA thioesterase n=1 Tax=Leptolyngbya ohadii TaxID=1962290 RepID=UPI000B5A1EB9|nr:thioesterase family protein [Leptolyngbya ohadii]
MPFTYDRTIHFSDTDAAGVVYFANVLSICHESYEALLAFGGMNLKEFFSGRSIAVPIVHASVDFLHPMRCGDVIQVQLKPTEIKASKFRLDYTILLSQKTESNPIAATAHTIHVCIKTDGREKTELPEALKQCLIQAIE